MVCLCFVTIGVMFIFKIVDGLFFLCLNKKEIEFVYYNK